MRRRAAAPSHPLDGELVGEDRTAFLGRTSISCPPPAARAGGRGSGRGRRARPAVVRPQAPAALRARVEALMAAPMAASGHCGLMIAAAAARFCSQPRPRLPSRDSSTGQGAPANCLPLQRHSGAAPLAADTHLRYTRGQLPLEIGLRPARGGLALVRGARPFNLTLPDIPSAPASASPTICSAAVSSPTVATTRRTWPTAWTSGRSRCS